MSRAKTAVAEISEAAQADQDLAAAQEAVARLEEQILAGEDGVGAADLVAAEKQLEDRRSFAARARELERDRAARLAEDRRVERLDQLDELIQSQFGEHDGCVVESFESATAALADLVHKVLDHNDGLRAILTELSGLGPLPAHLQTTSGQLRLVDVDVSVMEIDLTALLCEAAWRALFSTRGDAAELKAALDKFEVGAGVSRDRLFADLYGAEDLPGGSPGPTGPSDRLRRIAGIVSGRPQ